MRKLFAFARFMLGDQLVVSWRVGRKDFDGAIRVLEKSRARIERLKARFPGDGAALDGAKSAVIAMIAECHLGAQREDDAITAAKSAHALSPQNFEMNKLLAEFYFKRAEHDLAARHARLCLEHPPTSYKLPRFWVRLYDGALYVHPRLRGLATRMEHDLKAFHEGDVEWLGWAKRYLAWYDAKNGGGETPTVH